MSKLAQAVLFLIISITATHAPATLRTDVDPAVLLITDQTLVDAWQGFADFKTQIGLPTKVVSVQWIEKQKRYEAVDTQARIRACVLDHIENQRTRFIILGGDSGPKGSGLVPDRDTPHAKMGYRDIPTDLYYLSPGDADWDANDDGVYGDWRKDMDAVKYTHPSGASIGRIPVRTPEDVAAYTDKIIAYETRYPEDDFASRILYTNTVDGSEPKVRRSWDDYLSKAWDGGEALRFFHTQTSWDEKQKGDYALKTDHWVEQINQKQVGKMHMHGHGMPGFWVLEDDGGHTKCDAKIVDKLTNEDAYLVMTTVSCFTGMFDSKFDPTITETMLRAPKKGAVVVVAPSREGVPIFHNPRVDFRLMVEEGKLDGTTESMTRFWVNGLSPREDGSYRTIGEAFAAMKGQMTQHAYKTAGYHWCQCELNLLGDPTLGFRAKAPVAAKIEQIERSDTKPVNGVSKVELEFTTTLRGDHGARLCVWQQGGGYAVVSVGKDGRASVVIEKQGDGEVAYGLAGLNINAVTGTIFDLNEAR